MSKTTDKLQALWEDEGPFKETSVGMVMNLVVEATLDQERRLAALEIAWPWEPESTVTDHDHAAEVAAFGECITCAAANLPAIDQPAVAVAADARATSRQAAAVALPRSGTARRRVLDAIAAEPRTDEQLQAHLGMGPNTQRPRRVECVDYGWVWDSGERRLTLAGQSSIVWALTPAGQLAMRSR